MAKHHSARPRSGPPRNRAHAVLGTASRRLAFFDGTRHAGFEAAGEIRRKDFGLGFGALGAMLGDVVTIELDLEFIEPS
ncbi:MAG: YceI family protein [Pseudonocardiaceae bacterium]